MTDTTFRSDLVFAPKHRSVAARSHRRPLGLSQVMASLPVALLLMIPDSEVHAKLFKLGMIIDNLNQRVLPNLFS